MSDTADKTGSVASWPIRSVAVGCFGLVTLAMAHATGGVQDPIGEVVSIIGGALTGFGFGLAIHQQLRKPKEPRA